MPHEWNNIIVVTPHELTPWYKTQGNLRQAITRAQNNAYGIKKVQSGGNGRQMLIAFDSLPNEIQNALGDPRKLHHHLEVFYKTDADAVAFYQNYQFADGSYLSQSHQEQYITNASVLKALVMMKKARTHERTTKGGSLKGLTKSLLNDSIGFAPVLKTKHQVTHTLPESEKRFKQALNAFEKTGYASLISKKHKNTNSKKVTDEIISLLNNLFAKQSTKPTRTEVSRQYDAFLAGYIQVVNNETGEIFHPAAFKPLSEGTIINWLGKWSNIIGTYAARSGNRQKLIQQFKPYHSMSQPKYAGSIISIDDRQPVFTYGNNKRAWFYNGIDLASEAFTVWVYGTSKEGIIEDFYRQMVRQYAELGLPLPIELEGEMSLNSNYLNTFLREGYMFEKVHIEANNARGKRIEAYYRPLRYELEKQREGWLARPFAMSESNQASGEKVPEVPYTQIIAGCLKDIQTWNNMPHSKFPEMSRWDYFLKNQNPNAKPINYKGILPYIGRRTNTSCNAGIIRLNNQECLLGDRGVLFTGDKLINLMTRVEGEALDIYWLDGNDGNVLKALIYIGDQYMGEAIAKPVYNRAWAEQTEEDKANRELMSAYVATIDAYMRDQKAKLERLVVVDNRVTTVNNNFKIRGIEDIGFGFDANEVEIMPEAIEPETIEPATSKSIKDRF